MHYNVGKGHLNIVPTDWQFFIYYYVMYFNMFSSKRIIFKTWVEPLVESDIAKINGEW